MHIPNKKKSPSTDLRREEQRGRPGQVSIFAAVERSLEDGNEAGRRWDGPTNQPTSDDQTPWPFTHSLVHSFIHSLAAVSFTHSIFTSSSSSSRTCNTFCSSHCSAPSTLVQSNVRHLYVNMRCVHTGTIWQSMFAVFLPHSGAKNYVIPWYTDV